MVFNINLAGAQFLRHATVQRMHTIGLEGFLNKIYLQAFST